MREACLNGFALLQVHHDFNINFEHAIDEFSRKNSKLNLNKLNFDTQHQ